MKTFTVHYGVQDITLTLEEPTVGEVRQVVETFGIKPGDAAATINGNGADDNAKIDNNDKVEFRKEAGSKG